MAQPGQAGETGGGALWNAALSDCGSTDESQLYRGYGGDGRNTAGSRTISGQAGPDQQADPIQATDATLTGSDMDRQP